MEHKQSRSMDSRLRSRVGGVVAVLIAGLFFSTGCDSNGESGQAPASGGNEAAAPESEEASDFRAAELAARTRTAFGPLPLNVPNPDNPATEAKVDLGRMLYYDPRLSKNHDISCNSCHLLDAYGVDGQPTSPGHRGQRGDRNSPTVYNAAIHVAQFWDGREPDVEAQAKGPVLNPIEMAAPSADSVVALLASIPGYVEAFSAAFPDQAEALSYDNMARAIGVFERNLLTPGSFDAFMEGDLAALDPAALRGLETFLAVGCNSCHMGPAVGGSLYRKIGFIFPYETQDKGRENVTGEAIDRHVFKVPSLRNIARTGPYFHDGSISDLSEVVRLMGYHQLGLTLTDEQISEIVSFLGALTGEIDTDYVAKPTLPASGPDTPAPDPS